MGESVQHMRLVKSLAEWVVDAYFENDAGHVLIDSPENSASAKPPRVYGFVPDVYAERSAPRHLVIGEAKTARDLENRHTRDQLTAFLTRCGQVPDSALVVAVPWHMTRFARALLRVLQRQADVREVMTVVLDALEG